MSSLSADAAALLSVLVHAGAESPQSPNKALSQLTSALLAQVNLQAIHRVQPQAQTETTSFDNLLGPMKELFTQFSNQMQRIQNPDGRMERIAESIQAQLSAMSKLIEAHNEQQRLQQQNFQLQIQLYQQTHSSHRLSRSYSGRRQRSCSRSPGQGRSGGHVFEPNERSHTAALPVKRPRTVQPKGSVQSMSKKRRMLLDDDPPETNTAG
ncbi:hypothetical protein OC845_000833 [Tilletia horrida]|nr:hypothetical protein OC845_000833 [Tilletia horrida]